MTPQPSEIVIPSGSCSDDSTSGDSGYQDDISSKGSDTSEPPELPERSDLPEVLERPDSPEMESPGQIESFEMTLETLDQEQQEKPLEPLKPLDISSTPSPILKALPPLITTHVPQSKPFLKIVEKTIVATAKVVVLGNSGVGKTSIIYSHRFNLSGVQHHTATIGASYVKVLVDVGDNRQVQLQVWDTAGQERFRCMVPMYTRNAAAAFVFYDICSRTSFQDVDKWVNDVRRCCGDIEPDIILIGNKTDCEEDRQVTKDEGQIKAIHLNAMFFEMNATTPAGINSVFDAIAERVHKQMEDPEPSDSGYESMSSSTMSSSGYGSQSSSVMHSPAIRLESPMNSPFISLEPSTPKKSRDCCTLL